MLKGPTLLITFVEVVHRASMVKAAQHLAITPAAVSKQIQALETQVGLPLLKRSTRRVELTPEGQIYFEHAKQILTAYQQADAALSHAKEEPSGLLKVVCGPQIGYQHLLPHLREFTQRYPQLRLQMDFTQIMPDLEKENVDVVLGLTAGIPSSYVQRTLFYARWVLCASPAYLKRQGTPKRPSDLASHQLITHMSRQPNNVIDFSTGESIHFDPLLYFNDTRAMRRAALQELGIVRLHDYIVSQDIEEGQLVEILAKHSLQAKTIPIHISYRPSSQVHLKVRKFVDFMVEVTAPLC
jgi:DNA-binding transcriptional LysR family regulator